MSSSLKIGEIFGWIQKMVEERERERRIDREREDGTKQAWEREKEDETAKKREKRWIQKRRMKRARKTKRWRDH